MATRAAVMLGGLGAFLVLARGRADAALPDEGDTMSTDPPGGVSEHVRRFALAVARAEGYGEPGAIPTRLNNPGDLKSSSIPSIGRDASGHLQFATPVDGWRALHRQIQLIVDGRSRVYTLDMTIAEMASRYAEGATNWATNVASALGVTSDTTLREVLT